MAGFRGPLIGTRWCREALRITTRRGPWSWHACSLLVNKAAYQGFKNSHQLSERLASLGIIGARLRAPLEHLNIIVLWWSEGFQRALPWCWKTPVYRTAVRRIGLFFSPASCHAASRCACANKQTNTFLCIEKKLDFCYREWSILSAEHIFVYVYEFLLKPCTWKYKRKINQFT